ncbi:MAG TPA: hypothetical protein VGH89_21785 [Pseudonocardia sp.]
MRVRHWAPSSPENATGFFATTAAIHHAVAGLPTLAPVLARFGGDTTADFVARFVSDPTLSAVLGGWAAYFGYGAHRIAAVAIAEFTEACFDGGVLQPEGGITALTDALRGVIGSSGGLVLLSAPVAEAPVSLGVPTVLNPVLAPDGHHIALLYTFTPPSGPPLWPPTPTPPSATPTRSSRRPNEGCPVCATALSPER